MSDARLDVYALAVEIAEALAVHREATVVVRTPAERNALKQLLQERLGPAAAMRVRVRSADDPLPPRPAP